MQGSNKKASSISDTEPVNSGLNMCVVAFSGGNALKLS